VSTWADLEALAAEEALVVAEARFDELGPLYVRRWELLGGLPTPLPSEAVAAELGKLDRGRTGVRGYARTFDVQP
jgi:hypothetical protein